MQSLDFRFDLRPFFMDMPLRIANAHLVICRSGASTIAELGVIGRPAIMVPLPHALDNDQLRNAESFAAAGAGWIKPQADLEAGRICRISDATALSGGGIAGCREGGTCPRTAGCCPAAGRPDGKTCGQFRKSETGEEVDMKLPRDVGPIHFIGIGGIGMSGIAEVMATLGYKVQGSDLSDNYNVARLRKNGIEVSIGHQAANIGDVAGRCRLLGGEADNPELVEARARYPADRAAGRDAGRTHALQILRGGWRHAWQDHDDFACCGACSMPAALIRP